MERCSRATWIGCTDCDLLQRIETIPEGSAAKCCRCGRLLRRRRRNGMERSLALSIAAAVLLVAANVFPFLAFEMKGQVTRTTLVSGALDLYRSGFQALSTLVLVTSVLAPLLQIALLIYVLVPLQLGRVALGAAPASRLLARIQPWSMMEVFMIGILVSIVKLQGMHATIVPGLALWSFAMLIVVLTAATASLDLHEVWERVEARR